MKPIIATHNVETNQFTNREMTDKEFSVYKKEAQESDEKLASFIAKSEAKEKAIISATEKLASLGLTAEEITAITGA